MTGIDAKRHWLKRRTPSVEVALVFVRRVKL
jgi:hypothetical protein